MKRSVTRLRVSTRRATVPWASVACSSSSRLSVVAADVEAIFSVLEHWPATVSPSPGKKLGLMSGAGDAVASLCLGGVKRAIGAREKSVGVFVPAQRRYARGHRDLHARRERAPVELGDDGAQPVEH